MAAGVNPDQALAELIDVSAQIQGAAILDAEGAVLASIGGVGDGASALLRAADEAARLLGRPAVAQCEVVEDEPGGGAGPGHGDRGAIILADREDEPVAEADLALGDRGSAEEARGFVG
ncbi:MAG: hypothetical protein ACKOSO_03420, partial [Actinomycetota bacterium]